MKKRRDSELEIEKRWMLTARVDPEKFLLFYDKYFDRIYRFAYFKILDHDVAEDVTSTTFLRAMRNLDSFRWKGYTFGTWLYRIAYNEIRAYFNRRRRTEPIDANDVEAIPARETDVLGRLVLDERQAQIYRSIAKLDEVSQSVFILYYWEGYKTKEIAAILDISEGTVKAKLSRGRHRLFRLLKPAFSDRLPRPGDAENESAGDGARARTKKPDRAD